MKIKNYLILHVIFFLYSLCGLLSKFASTKDFLSFEAVICYSIVFLILFIYAILWQQILKKTPLSTAYLNKAVVVIWGILWGVIFFDEKIKWNMFLGAIIIVLGIYLVVKNNE